MEQQTSSNSPVANNYDNSYNYGQYSTFLPNVSPSASSLDSGYCGPASVQSMHSSIDSPHNNLGYPSSPWTTDLTVGDLANWLTTNYLHNFELKIDICTFFPLESVCCKKQQKSPNQETGLGNRGHLKVMNDTKLVLNEHEWPF